MNRLPPSLRVAGVAGRATIYRSLINMAGRNILWPIMVVALLLVIVPLSLELAAMTSQSVKPDATTQVSSTTTAASTEAKTNSRNSTASDPSTRRNDKNMPVAGAPSQNTLAVLLQGSRPFFEKVSPSGILILITAQAPGETDEDFWARYQKMPQELHGALIEASTDAAPQSTRLNVFVPEQFPDTAAAMSFCSSVPGLDPCNLRQLHWP